MNYKQAKQAFDRNFVFDPKDVPEAREAWVTFIDILHKNGDITDRQVNTWDNPFH